MSRHMKSGMGQETEYYRPRILIYNYFTVYIRSLLPWSYDPGL